MVISIFSISLTKKPQQSQKNSCVGYYRNGIYTYLHGKNLIKSKDEKFLDLEILLFLFYTFSGNLSCCTSALNFKSCASNLFFFVCFFPYRKVVCLILSALISNGQYFFGVLKLSFPPSLYGKNLFKISKDWVYKMT